MNRNLALKILGLSSEQNVSEEDIKKAYLNSVKIFHPDNTGSDLYLDKLRNCQEAYEFLTNSQRNEFQYTPQAKVFGGGKSSYGNHQSYQKKQQRYREEIKKRKEQEYNELRKKARELNNKSKYMHWENVNYKAEEDIINQIKWLKLAGIIHEAIEADKRDSNNSRN